MGTAWIVAASAGYLIKAVWSDMPIEPVMLLKTALGSLVFGALIGLATAESARSQDFRASRLATPTAAPRDFELLKPRPAGA